MIDTLADTFKLPHQSILKLKKYEALLYIDEHEVSEINQIIDTQNDTNGGNNSKCSYRNVLNKTSKNLTYWGTCWRCNEFGHLAKEYQNIPSNTNQFGNNMQEQTMINTFRNSCSDSPALQIKYHTTILPTKPPILT